MRDSFDNNNKIRGIPLGERYNAAKYLQYTVLVITIMKMYMNKGKYIKLYADYGELLFRQI